MIVLVSKYLVPKGFSGLTVFPIIFLSDRQAKENPVIIQHEKIHLRQQLELFILPFFIWYVIEFLYHWFRCFDKNKAYKNISFEREAYSNDNNFTYLKNRGFWEFRNYIGDFEK
jgi:hypothetical protein